MEEEKKLTITEHLEELRQRVIKSVAAVAITTAVSFIFAPRIFDVLMMPAQGIKPIYTQMTEMLGTYMKVALLTGVVAALPFLVYQLVMFASPALTSREKRSLYLLLPGVTLSFLAGVAFGYFVLLPPALRFLLTFGSDIAIPQIKIGNYISLVTTLLFWIGVVFETPFLMFFLARIRVITPQLLSRNRKLAVVGAFILGALITPTFDPINQSLVAFPIIALYELGIWLAKLARRGEKRDTVPAVNVKEMRR